MNEKPVDRSEAVFVEREAQYTEVRLSLMRIGESQSHTGRKRKNPFSAGCLTQAVVIMGASVAE